jgi:hypothetical protein
MRYIVNAVWNVVPSVLAVICAAWVLANMFLPTTYWAEVRRLRVDDAEIGVSPLTHIDLEIYRPFEIRWRTSVRKEDANDAAFFSVICYSEGTASMYPGRRFPKIMDIGWWERPNTCPMPKGHYILEVSWEWDDLGFHRTLVTTSNIFHIPPEVVTHADTAAP